MGNPLDEARRRYEQEQATADASRERLLDQRTARIQRFAELVDDFVQRMVAADSRGINWERKEGRGRKTQIRRGWQLEYDRRARRFLIICPDGLVLDAKSTDFVPARQSGNALDDTQYADLLRSMAAMMSSCGVK